MNLLKFFGLQKNTKDKPYPYKDILHLWEDDYLMIELLPNDNLEFIKNETRRINNFGQEHFDGSGFSEIMPVKEKPVKTVEKLIDISEIEKLVTEAGLEKIYKFHMQGVGLLEGDKAPIGFGTNKFAIMCEKEGGLLKDIWLTGHTDNEEDKHKLINALALIGKTFNFIGVNWFKCEHYNLIEISSIKEFVKNSC